MAEVMTPLDQIDAYVTLKLFFQDVESMARSEIYDPEGLTDRFAAFAAETPRLVNLTLSNIQVETAFILKQMVASGQLSPQSFKDLEPRILALWATEEELGELASFGASAISIPTLLRIARYMFLTIAFLVSFVIGELVARQFPDSGSSIGSRLVVGVAAFIIQLQLFSPLCERFERSIKWRIFERRRQELLLALERFIELCSRVWHEGSKIIPTVADNALLKDTAQHHS